MVPNRIVRYFAMFGYALSRGGFTRFSVFKKAIVHFYSDYLGPGYFIKKPSYYAETYGMN